MPDYKLDEIKINAIPEPRRLESSFIGIEQKVYEATKHGNALCLSFKTRGRAYGTAALIRNHLLKVGVKDIKVRQRERSLYLFAVGNNGR